MHESRDGGRKAIERGVRVRGRAVWVVAAEWVAAGVTPHGLLAQAGPSTIALHHAHLNSVDPDAAIEWYLRVGPGDGPGVVRSGLAPYGGIRTLDELPEETEAARSAGSETDSRPGGFGYLVGPDGALVPSRGQVLDHVAFAVPVLAPLLERIEGSGVEILDEPCDFQGRPAILVAGPDGLAVELAEVGEVRGGAAINPGGG